MNLSEFLDVATFEGDILIKAWDEEKEECIFTKFLNDFSATDTYAYSWLVRYVYPITYYKNNNLVPCVVIEIHF